MQVCRSAWQRLAPATQRSTAALLRNAPSRQMSAGSVPGSAGDSWPYYAFVGIATLGGGIYLYRTLNRDKARFRERHEFMEQLKPQSESGKDGLAPEAGAVTETVVEAVIAAIEEAAAEEIAEQEAAAEEIPEEKAALTTSQAQELLVIEVDAPEAPTEEEPVKSTEVAAEQVEQENVEPEAEAVAAEASLVFEASSENIAEEVASASEDWSELSAHKPEEADEESSPALQENEEATESQEASASS